MATQPVESSTPAIKVASTIQSAHYKLVITLYRIFAIAVLYIVLAGIFAYAFVMGFYAVNSSWAAPIILTASGEKSLDFREKLLTSQQTIEDLNVDTNKLQSGIAEMTKHRAALLALEPELKKAIVREQAHNKVTGPQLAALDQQKAADISATGEVMKQMQQVQSEIQKDLANGLITKGDAETQIAALNQAKGAYTDSKIAEVLLRDSVLQKTTTGTDTLDVLDKQAELQSEAAQLDVEIDVAQKQLKEEGEQILRLHDAIQTAKQSPYYLISSGDQRLFFAFVPYDNRSSAVVGAPVYDCYLNMIFCSKVGVIEQKFTEEEDATHPIYKTIVRGFLVQLKLDHARPAKSKTLFLGRKPLLF